MGKLNARTAIAPATSVTPASVTPVPARTTSVAPDIRTHEGGAGFSRDPKSALYLLAVTNMVAEGTFYESSTERASRFEGLIGAVLASDTAWVKGFIPYLRDALNMRTASIVMAAQYAHSVSSSTASGSPRFAALRVSASVRNEISTSVWSHVRQLASDSSSNSSSDMSSTRPLQPHE
jgi:hypothetical protein